MIDRQSAPRVGVLGLEQRFLARWRARSTSIAESIIVGFSAGPDSLTLAIVLMRLRRAIDRDIVLVHVDHGLRATSGTEADQARRLAAAIGLPFELITLDTNLIERHPGVGVEEAARRERYRAFAHLAERLQPALVVTAHHRDDQAETVLLHLLRGAGLAGARGFAEWTELVVPWWPAGDPAESRTNQLVTLWRPFRSESRDALADYRQIVAPDIHPVTDPSNVDATFRRNAIRARILPLMGQIVPGASDALTRYADVAAGEDALLDQLAATYLVTNRNLSEPEMLPVAAVRSAPAALQRRLIRLWLHELGYRGELTLERVDAIVDGAKADRGGWRIELPGGKDIVSRRGATIMLTPSSAKHEQPLD